MTDYQEYLDSPEWRRRKAWLIAKRGHHCENCGQFTRNPDVHHKTYERLGFERDTDLELLCRPCHDLVHADAEQVERWPDARRLWRIIMLSPSLTIASALLRGETVPIERLDPEWVKRFGLK